MCVNGCSKSFLPCNVPTAARRAARFRPREASVPPTSIHPDRLDSRGQSLSIILPMAHRHACVRIATVPAPCHTSASERLADACTLAAHLLVSTGREGKEGSSAPLPSSPQGRHRADASCWPAIVAMLSAPIPLGAPICRHPLGGCRPLVGGRPRSERRAAAGYPRPTDVGELVVLGLEQTSTAHASA